MRKICVITGYRSDYTKLKSVLKSVQDKSTLELQLVVFAAHLLSTHGNSVNDIENDGYKISYRCNTNITGDEPLVMSKSVGIAIVELSVAIAHLNPDVVLIVGDRYEILAAAIAASVGNIPVAHIQGGEISGTVDETIRHTITKLAHIHFPSTALSAKRIASMGEDPQRVFNVGCPAIDHIKGLSYCERLDLTQLDELKSCKLDLKNPYILLLQHPVTTEYQESGKQITETLEALEAVGVQTLLIYPNPDAGSAEMLRAIRKHKRSYGKKTVIRAVFKNLSFETYLNLLKNCSCLVGNSSSGIREAHMFGVPVVNIGSRQSGRERTSNITDVSPTRQTIIEKMQEALARPENYNIKEESIYGDGKAGQRIADILENINLELIIQKKLRNST